MIIKIPNLLVLSMLIATIWGLFTIKNKVIALNYQLSAVNKQVNVENDHIHLLKAEFTYLNSPARLRELANKYLNLENIKLSQMIKDPLIDEPVSIETIAKIPLKQNIKWRYKRNNNRYVHIVSSNNKLAKN